jgi:CHAT domain-containing protein/Tfp pilus assembly protein PilF
MTLVKLAGWAIAVGIAVGSPVIGTIAYPEMAIAQAQTSELDRAIAEGMRLGREGSKESFVAAIRQFEIAAQLSQAANNQAKQALALVWLGFIYDALGEKPKALEYYNQALPLSRVVGDRGGEAGILNNIGLVYDALGEKPKALEYYNRALPLSRAVGNRSVEATTLNNIGLVYSVLGEKPKALEYYNRALPLSRAVGNRSVEATTLNNIGGVYDDLGEKPKALDYYNQALPILRAVGDRSGEATTLNNIGLVYSALGEKPKALDYYNQALPILRAVGNRSMEATTLNNIGGVYSALGEKPKALDYYNQALPILRAVENRSMEATTLNNIGLVYSALGEKPKALDYYNQALPILRAVGDRSGEATTLNNIGGVYDDLGEKPKALDYYNQALPILRAVGNRSIEATTLNNIGFLLASQKQPELAIVFYKQSVSQYEILRQNIRTLPKETQETYTKTVEYTYRNLADLLLKADRVLEAQQVLDLLKVQELNNYLNNVRGGTQELYVLPPETEILNKFGALQTSAIELGQKLTTLRVIPETSRTQSQQQEIDRLVQLQDELNQQFNQFRDRPDIQKLLTALTPKVLRQTVDTSRLDALRDDLKKLNAVLIYPLILDERLELIITTPDSPPLRRTVNVKREELNTAIKDFRTALQDPSQDPKPIAQKLYNWLIKPLEAELKTSQPQTLIYAPDAQLRYIPLAALHDGKQYLTERYAINHITAQSLTDLTAQPSKAPKILAGAIGNRPVSIALGGDKFSFRGLPYTSREVQSIQTLQPNTRILDGDNFSLSNVRPKLGDYNILHLATHASLVPKKVENSFILFGSSTYATLRDIESWTLNNFDLVVLSACETGLGGNFGTNGEEILGLGYQFQTRGAKATIASLWQVNDGSTSKLMEQFYTQLSTGKLGKAEALRQAQIALIQGNGTGTNGKRGGNFTIEVIQDGKTSTITRSLSHPFYWAPFILIGNGL